MVKRDEKGRVVSGVLNPNGAPKKEQALTEILRSKVDKDEVAEKLLSIAMEKEDFAALKYIYDRLDGKPVQSIHADIYQEENPLYEAIKELRSETEQETK